jgi:hypothetical protein
MAGSAHFFETGQLNVYQSLLAKLATFRCKMAFHKANSNAQEALAAGGFCAFAAMAIAG